MSRTEHISRFSAAVAVVVALAGLAGCKPALRDEPVVWKSRQLAFVVDRQRAVLQMLSVRSGVVLLKHAPLGSVDDAPAMLLDEERALLWVRCDDVLVRFALPALRRTGTWVLPQAARGATIEAASSGAVTLRAGERSFAIGARILAARPPLGDPESGLAGGPVM